MSTLSNHTKAFVQCCHGKHTVESLRTLLSDTYVYKQILAGKLFMVQRTPQETCGFKNESNFKIYLRQTGYSDMIQKKENIKEGENY
jgi:hypothetical protein